MQTDCLPGWEDSFTHWYEDVHLDEVLRTHGFLAAQRFALTGVGDPPAGMQSYLTIYELDDDPAAAHAALQADARNRTAPVGLDRTRTIACYYQAAGPLHVETTGSGRPEVAYTQPVEYRVCIHAGRSAVMEALVGRLAPEAAATGGRSCPAVGMREAVKLEAGVDCTLELVEFEPERRLVFAGTGPDEWGRARVELELSERSPATSEVLLRLSIGATAALAVRADANFAWARELAAVQKDCECENDQT